MRDIKEDVVGKWPGIFASLGINVGDGRHIECPLCGKKKFRLDDKDGEGTFICTCGAGDGWSLLMKKLSIDFNEAVNTVKSIVGTIEVMPKQQEPKITIEKFREIFNGAKKVTSDCVVGRYLKSRGLEKIPEYLWYHPAMWESETKHNQKTMLAIVYNQKGKGVSMHRTFLSSSGEKLKIESPKKLMPCLEKLDGGAIRLWPAGEIMGIAEGIESAIAASQDTGLPVWASYCANMLEKFEPPKICKHLMIFGDNDKNYVGQKAAYTLASRLMMQPKYNIKVSVYIPDTPGDDWLDVVLKGKS